MKFVSMDDIYKLSDEVGSAYVDVCLIDNELSTEKVVPIEVLHKLRQEIDRIRNKNNVVTFDNEAYKRYKHKIEAFDEVLKIIDKYLSNSKR